MASEEEMAEGITNLAAHCNNVDYIITHCAASSTQVLVCGDKYQSDRQTDYLESIKQKVDFRRWFFGHYHDNKQCSDKEIMLYTQIERIL